MHVGKAGLLDPRHEVRARPEGAAELVAGFGQEAVHFEDLVVRADGVVLRVQARPVLELDVTAGGGVSGGMLVLASACVFGKANWVWGLLGSWRDCSLVYPLHEARPVFDGGGHVAAMDEVEGGPGRPLALDVVDFEGDVWGDPGCVN